MDKNHALVLSLLGIFSRFLVASSISPTSRNKYGGGCGISSFSRQWIERRTGGDDHFPRRLQVIFRG